MKRVHQSIFALAIHMYCLLAPVYTYFIISRVQGRCVSFNLGVSSLPETLLKGLTLLTTTPDWWKCFHTSPANLFLLRIGITIMLISVPHTTKLNTQKKFMFFFGSCRHLGNAHNDVTYEAALCGVIGGRFQFQRIFHNYKLMASRRALAPAKYDIRQGMGNGPRGYTGLLKHGAR